MIKRKIAISTLFIMCQFPPLLAGGVLTNTNQTAKFARYMALDASTTIEAAYYNPAGLVKLKEGFHFSFTNQSAFQERIITATDPNFAHSSNGELTKKYKGTASAPIVPSFQGAYKNGKWVLSGTVGVIGGGGKATFENGLPVFESGMAQVPNIINKVGSVLHTQNPALSATADRYSIDQYMTGSNFIYGAQLGGSYEINEMFSVYGGFRLNIVNNHYKGYLQNLQANIQSTNLGAIGITDYNGSMASSAPILDLALASAGNDEATRNSILLLKKASEGGAYLDSKQSGWGISPIIGFNFSYEKLNVGMKYEFKTDLNVENKTAIDDTGMFKDGVNTAHDIPALLTVGVSYQILPQLNASVGYHHFFDRNARMSGDKQKYISGTDEYLAGVEYQINKMFLVSAGGQITRYGIYKEGLFQSDLSFYVNSYSLGFGGAINVSPNVQLNIGYFVTNYSDFDKDLGNGARNSYTRENKVFAAGVDFSF